MLSSFTRAQPSKARSAPASLGHWLRDAALPLWLSKGWDERRSAFHERLTLDGVPILDVPQRVMVQARQIAVCGMAVANGWSDLAGERMLPALEAMTARYWHVGGRPGWVMSVDRAGRLIDARRDFYAHAFVLYALAWVMRVRGPDAQVMEMAAATLNVLDNDLRDDVHGGWFESDVQRRDGRGERRQNPHMHLLEACLALADVAPELGTMARADTIVALMRERFFDRKTGVLREYFNADWSPVAGMRGTLFEPGHHFEWVWLLHQYAVLTGERLVPEAAQLYATAQRYGFAADTTIFDEVAPTGQPIKASRRSWPMAEAAKAALVLVELDDPASMVEAELYLTRLQQTFLASAMLGGWIDHIDAHGAPLVDYMPASTLYHVALAVSEYERVAKTVTARASY